MPAYLDRRDNRTWRYRKRVTLPDGTRERIEGTPPTNTKKAAEHAENLHILRVTNPGMVPEVRATPPKGSTIPAFTDFAPTFLDNYGTDHKPGSRRTKRNIVDNHLEPFFGGMRLDEIRQIDVDAFVSEQLKRVSRKTVNNRLAVLSKLVKYAADNIRGLVPNKLRCHVKAAKTKVHAVPASDVEKLLAAANDRYRVAVLLAAQAGLRVGEIRGLQWGDVAHDRLTVRRSIDPRGNVGPPKNGEARTLPLSPTLREALDAAPRIGLWVVPNEAGDVIGYWVLLGKKARVKKGRRVPAEGLHRVYDAAGLDAPDMPFHCLRHTFGTELAKRVPLPVVKELMGHKEISTTMRYVDVDASQHHDAIALVFGRQAGDKSARRA